MCLRSIGCALLTGLCLTIVAGCEKSGSNQAAKVQETQPDPPKISASETVARIHWLGKKRLTGETNAAFFMSVWDLPESSKLEAQTLDKLALTMTGLLSNSTNPAAATNSGTVALVRPLLEDLVKEESYIEVRSTTNRPGELGLAIRLN